MSPEIHVSSAIAVITLCLFAFVVYRWKGLLLAEHNVNSLMFMYTLVIFLLTGPFLYVLFRGPLRLGAPEASVLAFMAAVGVAVFMDAWQFGKNDGPTINFFLGEKIAERKLWVVPIMITVPSALFIGIFTFQLQWTCGVYWLIGIVGGVPLLNFLINKGINGIEDTGTL
jgi:hypothetical protein